METFLFFEEGLRYRYVGEIPNGNGNRCIRISLSVQESLVGEIPNGNGNSIRPQMARPGLEPVGEIPNGNGNNLIPSAPGNYDLVGEIPNGNGNTIKTYTTLVITLVGEIPNGNGNIFPKAPSQYDYIRRRDTQWEWKRFSVRLPLPTNAMSARYPMGMETRAPILSL